MYWREKFPTHSHALRAARAFRAGRPLTLSQHAAVTSALGELPETNELGSLKSFLKKASKLSPSHQLAKKLKITKLSPSHAIISRLTSSAPKSAPAVQAPAEPLMVPPTVTIPTAQDFAQPMSFSQGSAGGGGGFQPLPAATETPADTGPNWLLIGGIGAGSLLLLYLLFARKR